MKNLYQKIIGKKKEEIVETLRKEPNFEKYMTLDYISLQNKLQNMEKENHSSSLENLDLEQRKKAYNNFRKEVMNLYKSNKKIKAKLNEMFENEYHNYSSYEDNFSKPEIVLRYDFENNELVGEDKNCKWYNCIRVPFEREEREFSHDDLVTGPFKTKKEYDLKLSIDGRSFYFLEGKLALNQKISGGMGGISSYLTRDRIKPFYGDKMFLLIKAAEAELGKKLVDDFDDFLDPKNNPKIAHDDFKLIDKNWYKVENKLEKGVKGNGRR